MLSQAFARIAQDRNVPFDATSRDEVNLCNASEVEAYLNKSDATHVINCSGYTQVDQAESEHKDAFALNVEGVKNVAVAAAKYRKKLIHFSTDYVFDGAASIPYDESSDISPLSVYGKTKAEGEQEAFKYASDALVIRTSWLFGREGNHFVSKMLCLMQEREELSIVSDQRGRPTFCDDLVLATFALSTETGLFHFANAGETTWFEWVRAIKKFLEKKNIPICCRELKAVDTMEYKTPAKRPLYSVLGTKKYEDATQLAPRHWNEALVEYLEECHVMHIC